MPTAGHAMTTSRCSVALLLLLVVASGTVFAQKPPIRAENATIAWVPGWVPHSAYITVTNTGERTLELTDVSSDDFARIELHTDPDGGLMLWQYLELPQAIPPGESMVFEPGGHRLMLFTQSEWLEPGDTAVLRLHFRDFKPLPLTFTVRKVSPR